MPAGRPKKPAALRIAEGNAGHRPIAPEVEIDQDMPIRPIYLQGAALEKWNEIVPKLHKVGLLSSVDRDALEAYCTTYQHWREACNGIELKGVTYKSLMGTVVINPDVTVAHKSMQIMQQLMGQFGLSPKARANLGSVGKPADTDPFNAVMRNSGA